MSTTSYRLEVSPNARAMCQETLCKADKVKITKGELRLGTWVVIPEHPGSYKYRHWGCVSGKQLQNMRTYLEQGGPEGTYEWEYMDGLDEIDSATQDKFKTAIVDGKIADEDFRGDPEYNVLGKSGIRGRPKKVTGDGEDGDAGDHGGAADPDTPKPVKKRGRAKKELVDEDENEEKPSKRAKKAPINEDEKEEEPAKKAKKVKGPKSEETTIKHEDVEENVNSSKNTKLARRQKATKPSKSVMSVKAEDSEDDRRDLINEDAAEDLEDTKESKPPKKGRAKKVKKGEIEEDVIRQHTADEVVLDAIRDVEDAAAAKKAKAATKKASAKKISKKAAEPEEDDVKIEAELAKPIKKSRGQSRKKDEVGDDAEDDNNGNGTVAVAERPKKKTSSRKK